MRLIKPRPLTEKQLAANRANAKLSTGPRSAAGKLNSSRNATTHGFLAKSILIPGESLSKFLKLIADLTSEFEPSTTHQRELLQTMAVARWRTFRAWTLEAASLSHAHDHLTDSLANASDAGPDAAALVDDPPTRTMLAFRSLSRQPLTLENLSRHEGQFDRLYHRSADRLIHLKEKERKSSRESAKDTGETR